MLLEKRGKIQYNKKMMRKGIKVNSDDYWPYL